MTDIDSIVDQLYSGAKHGEHEARKEHESKENKKKKERHHRRRYERNDEKPIYSQLPAGSELGAKAAPASAISAPLEPLPIDAIFSTKAEDAGNKLQKFAKGLTKYARLYARQKSADDANKVQRAFNDATDTARTIGAKFTDKLNLGYGGTLQIQTLQLLDAFKDFEHVYADLTKAVLVRGQTTSPEVFRAVKVLIEKDIFDNSYRGRPEFLANFQQGSLAVSLAADCYRAIWILFESFYGMTLALPFTSAAVTPNTMFTNARSLAKKILSYALGAFMNEKDESLARSEKEFVDDMRAFGTLLYRIANNDDTSSSSLLRKLSDAIKKTNIPKEEPKTSGYQKAPPMREGSTGRTIYTPAPHLESDQPNLPPPPPPIAQGAKEKLQAALKVAASSISTTSATASTSTKIPTQVKFHSANE